MEFKDTSEYVYMSTLIELYHAVLNAFNEGDFSEEQIELLYPALKHTYEVLKMDMEDLNTDWENIN